MARNTGDEHRIGSVDDRSQVKNTATGKWTKRNRFKSRWTRRPPVSTNSTKACSYWKRKFSNPNLRKMKWWQEHERRNLLKKSMICWVALRGKQAWMLVPEWKKSRGALARSRGFCRTGNHGQWERFAGHRRFEFGQGIHASGPECRRGGRIGQNERILDRKR